MAFPTAWQETALIQITQFDASTPVTWPVAAMIETLEIDEGEAPGESVATIAGGRVWKDGPRGDGTITIEFYGIELDAAASADSKGLFQQFSGGAIDTTAEPLETDTSWPSGTSRYKPRYRFTVLWTNDAAATTADAATAASTDSLRFTALSCRMITHTASFTDGILKFSGTFKFPAMSKDGLVRQCKWDSADQAALVANVTYDDEDAYV